MQPKYKRVLLKLSGEALAGEKGFGLNRGRGRPDCRDPQHGSRGRSRDRRRKFLARPTGNEDGQDDGGSHGNVGDGDEFAGDDGRDRAAWSSRAGADGAEHGFFGGAVYLAESDSAF